MSFRVVMDHDGLLQSGFYCLDLPTESALCVEPKDGEPQGLKDVLCAKSGTSSPPTARTSRSELRPAWASDDCSVPTDSPKTVGASVMRDYAVFMQGTIESWKPQFLIPSQQSFMEDLKRCECETLNTRAFRLSLKRAAWKEWHNTVLHG